MENNTNSFDEKKKKKLTIVVVAMLVCIIACIIVAGMMFGITLARYVTGGTDTNKNLTVAKWGVTTEVSSALNVVSNQYVVNGKIAPDTEGYIDVKIKCPGTEVAVDYEVKIGEITASGGGTVPDSLGVDRVVPRTDNDTTADTSKDGTALTPVTPADASYPNGVYVGLIPLQSGAAFAADFEFVVRIYFVWENNETQNTADTALGNNPPTLTFTLNVGAKQHIPSDDTSGG